MSGIGRNSLAAAALRISAALASTSSLFKVMVVGADFGRDATLDLSPLGAMCGRLLVGKSKLHVASLVGAAMCSAY